MGINSLCILNVTSRCIKLTIVDLIKITVVKSILATFRLVWLTESE